MTTPPGFKRRTLVKALAAGSLIPLLGSNLIACSGGSNNNNNLLNANPADFNHGVASGDPLTDRVIVWTRVTPATEGDVWIQWELATDADFSNMVASGTGTTSADVDYTVKVDVEGLQPATIYYYRFLTVNNTSATGKTRTLPEGTIAAAAFAVVSCSNYPAGFFNVYREVANQEVDAVLHLGDYIYEYESTGYASERAEELGRVSQPTHEIITLADYRTRYGQYRGDVDLQAAHAAHPFIIVWDDHELANNTWREGANNHNPDTEGSFEARRLASLQAWHEWQPVRPPVTMDDIIYRRFQYGDLLDLLMLDTRRIGRDEQYTYSEFVNGGIIDVDGVRAAFGDSNRTMLGSNQLGWLREQLTQSSAQWQVLGQQVLMARYHLPAPIMEALDPGISPDNPQLAAGTAAVLAAVTAKSKAPEDREQADQDLLDSAIPYNLDAWDGYAFERDELLAFAQQLGSKLVVLAGDTHNAWTSQLTTTDGAIAGVEFGGTSVSSPGLDQVLGAGTAAAFTGFVTTLVDDLVYANLVGRGYMHVTFTREAVVASHRFITTIDSREYAVDEAATATASFTVNRSDMLLS